MLHRGRSFQVVDCWPEELASKLVNHTWCPCNGFRVDHYLFLNDSTSPDGAQEYAIIDERKMMQLESITFSWCDLPKAQEYIKRILAGEFDALSYGKITNKIQTPEEHGRCHHCA